MILAYRAMLEEKRLVLDILRRANPKLLERARVQAAPEKLS